MASGTIDYLIYLIDQGGKLDAKLDDTDRRGKCVIDFANVVRAIFRTNRGKSGLVQMATEFCAHSPSAWFLQEGQGTEEQKKKDVVRKFLETLVGRFGFPTLCPSDRLRYEDLTGISYRYEPQGPFLLSSERIVLNMVRLEKILDLETKSNSAEDEEGHILNACQTIKFQFVVTIVHEIGHIFVTYLGKGVVDTPQTLTKKPGESGFRLEELIFGGRLQFFRDKRVGDSDHGAGSILMKKQDEAGKSEWFSVTKEAIESTLGFNFQLPFGKGYIIRQKVKDLRGNFVKMEKREEVNGEADDPGLHPEWWKRLEEIDPEGAERLKKTFPKGYKKRDDSANKKEYFCRAAGLE